MKKKDKYAIYLRKSRKDLENKDFDVLKRHKQILLDFADKNKIPIEPSDIYEEVVSGETIQDRPIVQLLLREIENGTYKAVLVMEIERLARGNTIDQGVIAQAFQLTNTLIITPNKTYDTNNEYDNEYLEFGLFMSRREYKAITRRIQIGRKQSVKEGNYIGSSPPYGYDREKLVGEKGFKLIPNSDSQNVQLIFDLYLQDYGTSTLAYKLNDLQIKSKTGSQWTAAMVRNILTNKVYIGILTWGRRARVKNLDNSNINVTRPINKECEEYLGKHVPIIDEKIFLKVQDKLRANSLKKVTKSNELKNPLAGLIVCKKCGCNMVRRPYPNNRSTLLCKNKYCNNTSTYIHIVEERLLEGLKLHLKEFYYYLESYEVEFTKEKKDYKSQFTKIDKELKKLKAQQNKICEMLEVGAYSLELFKERSSSIQNKISILSNQKEQITKESKNIKEEKIRLAIPKIEKCLEGYSTLTVTEKNILLKSIIKKVYYNKDKSGGRWNPEERDEFTLEIELKI